MAKNGLRIMDSDMHVFEPHDLYLKYMNPKWGDRIPRGESRKKHGQITFTFADGWPVRAQARRGPSDVPPERSKVLTFLQDKQAHLYEAPLRRNYDPVSQLEAMDAEGLDVAVLFRSSPLHTNENFEPEYAMDLCRAWNDWVADFCKEDPKRLRPAVLITLHDVNLAVQETRRAVNDLGAVGLSLCPEPINGRLIHDRYFDPLWAEAEHLGVPICFHPPATPQQPQVSSRFIGHPNQHLLVNSMRNGVELILAASSFCAGGVLERFPKLKVAFLEGNCSWLPWLLYRLDEYYELQGELADIPLRQKPSEYFRQQCFISVDVDEALVKQVIDYLGDDNIVYSTDYPHIDSRWPHAVDTFCSLPGISENSKKKIFWDNCARLYGLS